MTDEQNPIRRFLPGSMITSSRVKKGFPNWPAQPDRGPDFVPKFLSRLNVCQPHATTPPPDLVAEFLREKAKEMGREMDRLIAENPLKLD